MSQNEKLFIKKPKHRDPDAKIQSGKGERKTFSIYKIKTNHDGSTSSETIASKEINSINEQFLSGTISFDMALRNIKKVFKNLQRKNGIVVAPDVFNNQNQKILNNYWEREYQDRDLVDAQSAKFKLQRAIEALGNVSLLSATKEEIQKQIELRKFSNTKQREIASKINLLLKFIKRDIRVSKKRKERQKVKYLTEDEMLTISKLMGDEVLESMVKLAFYSGARLGEIYALTTKSYNSKILFIDSQIDKEDVERDPKWGSKRKAYLLPNGLDAFNFWVANKDKIQISRLAISKRFKAACKKHFKDKDKHCKFHDLRHSYAIFLLSKGVNLTLIAQSMGNSVVVAQEYYAGFSLTDETIETVDRIVRAG